MSRDLDLAFLGVIGNGRIITLLELLRMQNLVTFNQDAQTRYYETNDKEIALRVAAFLQDLDIRFPNA